MTWEIPVLWGGGVADTEKRVHELAVRMRMKVKLPGAEVKDVPRARW